MTPTSRAIVGRRHLLVALVAGGAVLAACQPGIVPSPTAPMPTRAPDPTRTALALQPLQDERRALEARVELLREVADSVGERPVDTLRGDLDAVHEFLTQDFIPYVRSREEVVHPAVARALGIADVSSGDDAAPFVRSTEELAALRYQLAGLAVAEPQAKALRRVLYGLYALATAYLEKEARALLPIVEVSLSPEEAERLVEDVARARRAARRPTATPHPP